MCSYRKYYHSPLYLPLFAAEAVFTVCYPNLFFLESSEKVQTLLLVYSLFQLVLLRFLVSSLLAVLIVVGNIVLSTVHRLCWPPVKWIDPNEVCLLSFAIQLGSAFLGSFFSLLGLAWAALY